MPLKHCIFCAAHPAASAGLRPDAATLPDIDAAQNLGGWAVAALCRSMSLDNVFTFLTAALLERQVSAQRTAARRTAHRVVRRRRVCYFQLCGVAAVMLCCRPLLGCAPQLCIR